MLEGTNFQRTLALNASAGSGKTFSLTIRYITILILGGKVENIFALTFTNKAADEMKERIFEVLSDLENHEIYLKEIIRVTKLSKKEILKRTKEILESFMTSRHKIMTIDKFCNNILREFSHSLNITSNFQIGEHSRKDLTLSFLNTLYENKKQKDFLYFMENESIQINNLLDIFDSFYEKDKELVRIRGKYEGLNAAQILLEINLINLNIEKIVNELDKIVSANSDSSPTVLKSFKFLDIDEIFTKSWLSKDTLKYRTFNKIWSEELEEKFKELQVNISGLFKKKDEYFFTNTLFYYDLYKKVAFDLKVKENMLSFNDVLNLTYEVLNENEIDQNYLYFKIDSRVEHLLIDEFQDTSFLQYKILEPIIEEICAGSDSFSSFFYVGDIKQSIYKFRGSNFKLFNYVKEKFNIPEEDLLYNYRSNQTVVDFVNKMFEGKIKDYKKQLSFNEDKDGFIEEKIIPDVEFYDHISSKISDLLKAGEKPEDICLLTFTNKEISLIKNHLSDRFQGIEFVTDTTAKLIDQNVIKSIYNFIKYLYFKDEIYFKNFCSLNSLELDINEVNQEDYSFDDVLLLIKNIIYNFNLQEKDENVLKFLDICKRFTTIEDLIFGYQSLNESVINRDNDSGIKILTIHKSKGLEFKNLILIDKLKDENNRSKEILFSYNGLNLFDVKKTSKIRKEIDVLFKNTVDVDVLDDYQEMMKLMYVALTRAKHSITIFVNKKKSKIKEILNFKGE